ncbi:hypothetical protein PT2222_120097 [Paraburkholderia tropica]
MKKFTFYIKKANSTALSAFSLGTGNRMLIQNRKNPFRHFLRI